mmetsp:Transcript_108656/g.197860  ORF Transcript_108656/g.197860 Transcript_108656/m.197860 type:complete len:190 (+) Transcript_108656:137-706(+)
MLGSCASRCERHATADPVADRVRVDLALLESFKENRSDSHARVDIDMYVEERKKEEEQCTDGSQPAKIDSKSVLTLPLQPSLQGNERHQRRLPTTVSLHSVHSRHIKFAPSRENSVVSVMPYGELYGRHPASFHFDAAGNMIDAEDTDSDDQDFVKERVAERKATSEKPHIQAPSRGPSKGARGAISFD